MNNFVIRRNMIKWVVNKIHTKQQEYGHRRKFIFEKRSTNLGPA